MRCQLFHFLSIVSVATAFTSPLVTSAPKIILKGQPNTNDVTQDKVKPFGAATATAALAFLLAVAPQPALASNAAAQVTVKSFPPSSLQLDARGLPVVGGAVSGRYAMVDDKNMGSPSITIEAPKNVQSLLSGLSGGHVELDLKGLVASHFDVDIAATSGEATVKVRSDLIPPLPFKNSANTEAKVSGKKSDWSKVVNMGDGSVYYYNEMTDQSQFNAP